MAVHSVSAAHASGFGAGARVLEPARELNGNSAEENECACHLASPQGSQRCRGGREGDTSSADAPNPCGAWVRLSAAWQANCTRVQTRTRRLSENGLEPAS